MSDDLVKRLWQLDMHPESAPRQAADRIEALEARAEKAEADLSTAIAALSEEGRKRGEVEAERDALRKAGDRLSFCAQTSGGTAGTDDDLVDAIHEWADARAVPKEADT